MGKAKIQAWLESLKEATECGRAQGKKREDVEVVEKQQKQTWFLKMS